MSTRTILRSRLTKTDMTSIKIGISGKRFIPKEDRAKINTHIKTRIKTILKKHQAFSFTGYSAIAAGADTLFAEVVKKELGQPLQIILPFAIEEYKKDFKDQELKDFENLISENGHFETATTTIPIDDDSRNKGYFAAGKRIVDACDDMVIIWDGLKPGGPSGTAEMLGYLSEKRGHEDIPFIKVRPSAADPVHEMIMRKYEKANARAIKARNKYKGVWKWAIILGLMTVVCFSSKIAFHLEGAAALVLTFLELLFVIVAALRIRRAKRQKFHWTYLHERMKAETYRLFSSFYHADVEIIVSEQSRENGSSIGSVAEKINQSLRPMEKKSKWYTQYVIKSIIRDQCGYHQDKVGAIGNKHRLFEGAKTFIVGFFLFNLGFHLAHMIVRNPTLGQLYPILLRWFPAKPEITESLWYRLSIFINILCPAFYAGLEGIIYFSEWDTLRKHSASAIESLKEAEMLLPRDIEHCSFEECHKKQAEVLHLISSIMLTDNRNWNLLLENKDNYHLIV
jgi:ribosomal protein S20